MVIPGGAKTLAKRKASKDNKVKQQQQNAPNSSRSAGAGGSSSTMLKIYTDEAQGFKIDPLVVLIFAVAFIFSVVILHVLSKLSGKLL
ncbi:DEKNAAC100723 [Brettanomyces naardenensis]|uniref:Protein transport protein Sec61 subunit beta n=1 Tax=Brettanomyces naardenensis TaxID=13370 RepID=A0A448YEW2_BRENA|nr:DEKNAAC100723 [Brettanomyces naardenensis]